MKRSYDTVQGDKKEKFITMLAQRLKHATQSQHRALEAIIPLSVAFSSPDAYRMLLERFYGCYTPLEAALQQFSALAERCQKNRWLSADLVSLGMSAAEIEALPRCSSLPMPQTFAEALGCAYVLEGSTLGGQLILRDLQAKLPQLAAQQSGLRFFTGYGSATGIQWRGFQAMLAGLDSPADEAALIDFACRTFDAFHHWFQVPLKDIAR